jgi:Protein of unknown function (DUF2971)
VRELDEFFSLRVDQTLYHYTGIGGLLGLVQSNSIWASHAYYLNDSREILHACEVLKSVLSDGIEHFPENEREFLTQFVAWLSSFERDPFHIYIFSLSEQRSLLSQWRSYTPHGKGVSLGFSVQTLNSILVSSGFRIAKCLYDRQQHVHLMGVLREKMLVTFRQRASQINLTADHPSQKYFSFLEEFRGDLLQVLSVIKHSAFKEEAEWRIISPYYLNYTVPEIKFREGASMLMPYIEIKLPPVAEWELFQEVVLGPSRDNNLSHFALSCLLSNKKICRRTSSCGIPFRKW